MSGSSVCQPEGSEFEFYLGSQTNPTTNSLRFWLTERWHGLAGNGPYCGKRLSQALPRLHVGLPKSPRPGLSECASQSLRRGVRFWLTALVSAPGRAPALRSRTASRALHASFACYYPTQEGQRRVFRNDFHESAIAGRSRRLRGLLGG